MKCVLLLQSVLNKGRLWNGQVQRRTQLNSLHYFIGHNVMLLHMVKTFSPPLSHYLNARKANTSWPTMSSCTICARVDADLEMGLTPAAVVLSEKGFSSCSHEPV